MTVTDGLRYIDSDGHILEHPTAMPDYAPAEYRDRIWHIETDEAGEEWLVYNGQPHAGQRPVGRRRRRSRATRTGHAPSGARCATPRPGRRPGTPRPGLQDMDQDHIDLAVLYPTMLLGLQSERDIDFAEAQARAYNDWCSDHVQEGEGRLFGAGAVPPMHERRRRGPGGGGDPPGGRAARHGVGLHAAQPGGRLATVQRPGLRPDLAGGGRHRSAHRACTRSSPPTCPGACIGLRLAGRAGPTVATSTTSTPTGRRRPNSSSAHPDCRPSTLFTQAIANPVDVMSCIAYLLAGGVCERFPEAKFIFLEANGGWLVPWLERLDHHCRKFQWEVTDLSMLPSEYLRRQCWISFDPDEAMLRTTAESPLVGADRIIWASRTTRTPTPSSPA